jgi:hypothetical protein
MIRTLMYDYLSIDIIIIIIIILLIQEGYMSQIDSRTKLSHCQNK